LIFQLPNLKKKTASKGKRKLKERSPSPPPPPQPKADFKRENKMEEKVWMFNISYIIILIK